MKWGTVRDREKGRGGEGRGGEGQYTRNLGPEWTGIAPHAKEGFQVSRRDSGTGEGLSRQRGIIKGNPRGLPRELCHVPPIKCQPCTYRANCVYVVLIKNCV